LPPLIAVPLLHSSGAWIASTAAGGYVAGTLSSTWIGAFIAGNAGVLSALGITSAAGALTALSGGLPSGGAAVGSGLSAIGLAGVAQSLGVVPKTFLGLTVINWAAVASGVLFLAIGYFILIKKLTEVNDERSKGGLKKLTWKEIIAEVRDYEKQAMINILERLEFEFQGEIILSRLGEVVLIRDKAYKISDLEYIIKKSGKEYIALRSRIPFRKIVLFIVREGKF
jgi:hypothetical protein